MAQTVQDERLAGLEADARGIAFHYDLPPEDGTMEATAHEARTVCEDEVPARLAAHPDLSERVDAVVQVEIAGAGGGTWALDLTRTGGPARVAAGADPRAAGRITIAAADFADLLAGRQRWTDAFVAGRIKLDGDILLALKLRRLFAELAS